MIVGGRSSERALFGVRRHRFVSLTWRRVKLLILASGVFLSTNLSKSGCMLHRARSSPKR